MAIVVLIRIVFVIIWEMFHGRISLNSVLLLLLVNFLSGFSLVLIYISLSGIIRSSLTNLLRFSFACEVAMGHRNYFFCLFQQTKSSESKVKFRRLVIVANGFLKLLNLHMLTKQKNLSLPRNLAIGRFGKLPIAFSTK